MNLILFLAFWIACGVLAYGRVFAGLRHGYTTAFNRKCEAQDRDAALVSAVFGPIGLWRAMINHRHGFMWRVPK